MQLIVHASDGSPESLQVLEVAAKLATEPSAEVVVVVVPVHITPGKGGIQPVTEVATVEGACAIADHEVAQFADRSGRATAHVRHGNPAHEIASMADELRAEMIVIGSRGLGAIKGTVPGSVSHGAMKNAHVPVTIVKAPRSARA